MKTSIEINAATWISFNPGALSLVQAMLRPIYGLGDAVKAGSPTLCALARTPAPVHPPLLPLQQPWFWVRFAGAGG